MTDLHATPFSMLNLSGVPSVPGIYAWYAKFRAGAQDWKFRPGPSGDEAIAGFLDVVCRYAEQFESVPLRLKGTGAYNARWIGDIAVDYPFTGSGEAPIDTAKMPKLTAGVENEKARKTLGEILQKATPTFSAPLYVGVAVDLNKRMKDHHTDYTRTYEWLRKHPEDIEKIRISGNSFGARAAARQIAMEHLEVWVIDLSEQSSGIATEELREIAEAAEWFLHRVHSPILGRR